MKDCVNDIVVEATVAVYGGQGWMCKKPEDLQVVTRA